jgi:hypothetical protein
MRIVARERIAVKGEEGEKRGRTDIPWYKARKKAS